MKDIIRTLQLLRELRRGVRCHPEELRALQGKLLCRAIDHACRRVPYYRRVWRDHGVAPGSVRTLDDLGCLPIITPDRIRTAVESGELVADSADNDVDRFFSTSGSSGRSLRIPRGAVESRNWRAAGIRMQLEHGFRWWDTTLQFENAPGPVHFLQKLGVAPTTWIPQDLPLQDQLQYLVKAGADVIIGNTTILRRIGRYIEERRIQFAAPKVLFSMSEIIDDDSFATIASAFGVEPFDIYGMTEVGFIAWQCERRSSLHINADMLVVEILREDDIPARPGEIGRVVVTDLRGRTMPFLRYDTGDLALATEPCACGRTLPTMGQVEGRARDAIRLGDGRSLSQRKVMNHLAGTLRTGGYCLRQKSARRFLLEVTPEGFAPGINEKQVRNVLCSLLGDIDLVVDVRGPFPEGLKTYTVLGECQS